MSKLDDLIKEKCPNGVKTYTLGELGVFYGGLTGKSKNDFVDGNAKFITYKNVYSNPALRLDVKDKVKIADGEKQHTLEYGDIIFTGSSETPDECGFSSVVTTKTDEKIYLNSFCFFFRLNNHEILLPDFAKHLFRSNNLRYQIGKTASGVTRFNVSKERMKSVKIPVPPLEVQNEIVQILDNFAELTAELTAELSNRKKQYEYYRDKVLEKYSEDVFVELDKVCDKTENIRWKQTQGQYQYIDLSSVSRETGEISNTILISPENAPSRAQQIVKTNDVIFATTRPTLMRYTVIPDTFDGQICSTGYCVLRANDKVLPKWIFYNISSSAFKRYCEENQEGTSYPAITNGKVKKFMIPLPSLEEQKKAIGLLESFDTITTDIFSGLPAEIEARKKQYAYYRDKFLTFEEAK